MAQPAPRDTHRTPPRRYRSPTRTQQAAHTRAAVVRAARELFEADGFGGTTIAAIAARAQVSVPTVYAAFGSKAGLARTVVAQMEQSADAAAWRDRIAAEEDPHAILGAFAAWTCAFFVASRPAMEIAHGAGAELADLAEEGNAHRREALTALVERLAAMNALAEGLAPAQAVDRAWLVTGVSTYLDATQGCGWTDAAYTGWLSETLITQLLRRG